MELLIAALIAVQVGTIGVGFAWVRNVRNTLAARTEQVAHLTQDGFVDIARDIESVVDVRDSMDQEIRERQASIDTVVRLVGRQGRAVKEHIESNLHSS